ncbi:unnamed protein product [Darwinula stevensoni]|uniref:Galactosylgalactosylxylosylprotein 3-beta-glucuronosyltransferase n=1 Tax=Darwinula stevensoni TaxID=69355 RepID=A0A7R9AAH6_9CRUS|nr:unnamed protein product [Darwinula stevensoni]CAG0898385.1 unnamed protein product [Darwinula stevensoni]
MLRNETSLNTQQQNATMPYVPGYEEDGLLQSLNITYQDIEPLADDCTKIYVWHTRTEKVPPAPRIHTDYENLLRNSNLPFLETQLFLEDLEAPPDESVPKGQKQAPAKPAGAQNAKK